MNILITGGFGYLGGRIAQFLARNANNNIILCSRNKSVPPDWLPQAEVKQIDWNSDKSIKNICRDVDIVMHLAGLNAYECKSNPMAALEFNGVGTTKILYASVLNRVKKFIYFSTAHVYAAPLVNIINEESCTVNLHPYATSHRAAEDMVRYEHSCKKIEGVVIRLSNAFGVAAHHDVNCWMLLVNDLCSQAVRNKQINLKTSGQQRRDFIALDNVVRALWHIMNLSNKQLGNGVFNVGGQWAPRIIDMAKIIQARCSEIYSYKPEINFPGTKHDDIESKIE